MDQNEPGYIDPPKQTLRFLRWFCATSFLEEIEGDLSQRNDQKPSMVKSPKCDTPSSKALNKQKAIMDSKKTAPAPVKGQIDIKDCFIKLECIGKKIGKPNPGNSVNDRGGYSWIGQSLGQIKGRTYYEKIKIGKNTTYSLGDFIYLRGASSKYLVNFGDL